MAEDESDPPKDEAIQSLYDGVNSFRTAVGYTEEYVRGEADVSDSYHYRVVSRVRKKIGQLEGAWRCLMSTTTSSRANRARLSAR